MNSKPLAKEAGVEVFEMGPIKIDEISVNCTCGESIVIRLNEIKKCKKCEKVIMLRQPIPITKPEGENAKTK